MKALFTKIDITPELPVRLAGFGVERIATEVLDPIYARLFYFKEDDEILWIQFDLCAIGEDVVQKIQTKTGIQAVILSATHTHSGPCGSVDTSKGVLKGLDSIFGEYNENYVDFICDQIAAQVEYSRTHCEDCKLKTYKGKVKGLGSDRHDNSYGDEDVLLLEFVTLNHKALLVRLACHPTIMNAQNLKISADYCGEIEKNMDTYEMVAVVNGSCGDISTRFLRQGNGEREKERMGHVICDQLQQILLLSKQASDFKLKYRQRYFVVETKKVDSVDEAKRKLQEAKDNLELAKKENKNAQEIRVMESYVEGAQNNLLSSYTLNELHDLRLSVSLLKINDEIIVFVPVELFSKLSNPLKKEMNVEFVGYTNGYYLYMPDSHAYDLNYYESFSSPFKQYEAEKLMQEIKSWIKESF
ncbi:MAG: neutral/alkaline non-lysosomal ceramidase N-terminal domain-containing protein [Traorella sp.]